jgi:hypothetical protein
MALLVNLQLPEGNPRVHPDDFNPMKPRRKKVEQPQFSLEGAAERCGLPTVEWKAADVKVSNGSKR